jgi:hypothetical protein
LRAAQVAVAEWVVRNGLKGTTKDVADTALLLEHVSEISAGEWLRTRPPPPLLPRPRDFAHPSVA